VREDWATQATDTIEHVVGVVRDRTVVPARAAAKAVVFGLLTTFFVGTAVVLLIVALFRGVSIITGRMWAAYLCVGGILLIAGWLCWTRRSPRRHKARS
jgi:uncharacterized membrane protein YgdD (TMEM256/DUF423 family)